ncbi:MAG: conjugal transfer protein TraX [Proteobacteria bacterium]|nr:conjugal transfer protein TraX [Pseudomonadota bacterium]
MKNSIAKTNLAFHLESGSLEFIKWIALISMTIDHANRFFLNGANSAFYCLGRLAMPLFAFTLSYSLAHIPVSNSEKYGQILKRLLIYGLIAIPPFMVMKRQMHLYPFNIMFLLALSTASIYFLKTAGLNRIFAFFILLIGGFYVEYQWIGILFAIAAWYFCERPSLISSMFLALAYILLDDLNHNHWALLSLIVIFLASQIHFKVPRIKHFFYLYYPLHLYILLFLSFLLV